MGKRKTVETEPTVATEPKTRKPQKPRGTFAERLCKKAELINKLAYELTSTSNLPLETSSMVASFSDKATALVQAFRELVSSGWKSPSLELGLDIPEGTPIAIAPKSREFYGYIPADVLLIAGGSVIKGKQKLVLLKTAPRYERNGGSMSHSDDVQAVVVEPERFYGYVPRSHLVGR